MARIKLTPEAAQAVVASLKSSAIGFETAQCDCFENHDSQSKMMDEFEKRVKETRELIQRYESLLERDASELQSTCTQVMLSDIASRLFFRVGGKE